jgi:transposase-like protein
MDKVHMGRLLERAIRKKGLNISEVAVALNINRRTLYNWFKQDVLDEHKLTKVSDIIKEGLLLYTTRQKELRITTSEPLGDNDELYWHEKYTDLLNRYSRLIKTKKP